MSYKEFMSLEAGDLIYSTLLGEAMIIVRAPSVAIDDKDVMSVDALSTSYWTRDHRGFKLQNYDRMIQLRIGKPFAAKVRTLCND